MTPAVPLGDTGLSALRGSLDGGAPIVPAHLVRALIARLDAVEAKNDELAGVDRALREAVAYQAAIIARVEEVADWALPVCPDVLRVALDPARSLQGAEDAAHAAAATGGER